VAPQNQQTFVAKTSNSVQRGRWGSGDKKRHCDMHVPLLAVDFWTFSELESLKCHIIVFKSKEFCVQRCKYMILFKNNKNVQNVQMVAKGFIRLNCIESFRNSENVQMSNTFLYFYSKKKIYISNNVTFFIWFWTFSIFASSFNHLTHHFHLDAIWTFFKKATNITNLRDIWPRWTFWPRTPPLLPETLSPIGPVGRFGKIFKGIPMVYRRR
jgi:hypothetical protein